MLTEINIKNFAIIDEMKVTFDGGLNILSGETGAGKSIIIGAVSLLLGDRASADMIRSSEDAATVEAFFDIRDNALVKEQLNGMGIYEGDDVVIKRVVSRSGKNRVYINGHLVSLGMLSAVSESLVNICGQHEHQLILNTDNHIDILDEFAGLLPLRIEYAGVYQQVQTLHERNRELTSLKQRRIEREDWLRFQMKEIEEARLEPGQDVALQEEKKKLQNIQKLTEHAGEAYEALYGKEGSVLEVLRGVMTHIREIKRIDGSLRLSEDQADALFYQLEDTAFTLRDYVKDLFPDPARLESMEERLVLIGRLKRKYGGTIESILMKREEMSVELAGMASVGEEIEAIKRELAAQKALLAHQAIHLSQRRREAAKRLKKAIEAEIRALKMKEARFEILFRNGSGEPSAEVPFTPKGIDQVEFYLTTNVGEVLKPMNRIASGGELSRIILAMKKVLARTGSVGTIIFDEVDSGIGGAAAEVVGEKIKDVSQHHQVLCITHLPQIACFADRHYRVSKTVSGKRTMTQVDILSEGDRLEEIARMLGGVEITEKTKAHAREMLLKSCKRGNG